MIRKLVLPLLAIIGLAVAIAMVIRGNRAAPSVQAVYLRSRDRRS